jgi:hypothetical protein
VRMYKRAYRNRNTHEGISTYIHTHIHTYIHKQENLIAQQSSISRKSAWSLTADGEWVRITDSGQPATATSNAVATSAQRDDIERVLAHARTLPPKEADEFLSQDFVRSILRGVDGQRQSDKILQV